MTTKKEAFAVPTIYLSPSTQEYNPYVTLMGRCVCRF